MRTLSLIFCQNSFDGGHNNSYKIHLVQDIYSKKLKIYLQKSDKENQKSVINSIETLNEVTLDQSTLTTLNHKSISDPFERPKNTILKNPNRLIIAQLSISSLSNKFDSLVRMLHNNPDILLICETNIGSSFPTA